MVIGDGQKCPAALLVPDFAALKAYCSFKGIPYSSDHEMIRLPEIVAKFQREVEESNKTFAQYERIKKFELLPKLWTIESGELTPKLSLKRKILMANNKTLIDRIYE